MAVSHARIPASCAGDALVDPLAHVGWQCAGLSGERIGDDPAQLELHAFDLHVERRSLGGPAGASGGALAGHRRQRLVQGLFPPRRGTRSKSSVASGLVRPRRQPVAAEHLVEDLAELGAHLLEVGGWRLPADADVRRPVDEAVIEDGVHRVPLPDAPQVGAREDVMVIDLARLDEFRSERRARVEVPRALQQGQRNRSLGTGPAAVWSPCATAPGSTRMPGPPAARPRRSASS